MEKIKTRYSTILLLVVFIGAFISQSLSCMGATIASSNTSFKCQQAKYIHSSLEVVNSFGSDLFENETEDDSDLLDFILPQSNINFLFETASNLLVSPPALATEYTKPLYILVCNFRV